jgi:hypothetical protein
MKSFHQAHGDSFRQYLWLRRTHSSHEFRKTTEMFAEDFTFNQQLFRIFAIGV